MVGFDHYDFKDDFSFHEVACLCIGISPNSATNTTQEYSAAYRLVINSARKAATAANAHCARVFFGHADKSFHGLLVPAWAKRILIAKECGFEFDLSKWPPGQEEVPFEEWTFDRSDVAEWLAYRDFKPAYDFGRNGGVIAPRFDRGQLKGDSNDQSLRTIERNTLLKLVIGMAVSGYSYDPKASKSSTPKEIAEDLAGLGISITDDTVRKYLKEAAQAFLSERARERMPK